MESTSCLIKLRINGTNNLQLTRLLFVLVCWKIHVSTNLHITSLINQLCVSERKRKDQEDTNGAVTKRQAKEGVVGSGRRVAQNVDYNEQRLAPPLTEPKLTPTVYTECLTERDALKKTGSGSLRK